jgi:signal peptidase I
LLENGSIPVETQPEPARTRPAWLSFTLEILQTVILALLLYFMIDSVLARVRVENVSMQPTLQSGNFILVNKLAYKLGEPHYGDVIIFHPPDGSVEDYIKRVIGLPGDHVEIRDGKVFINGNELYEPYIAAPPRYNYSGDVPEGHLFVLGDNRNRSSDSHEWGFVPLESVIGKALVVYWPLEEIKTLVAPTIVRAANGP